MKLASFFYIWILLFYFSAFGIALHAEDSFDVVLLPTEDFRHEEAVFLADKLQQHTGLRIKVSLPMGAADWQPHTPAPQYDPAALQALALPAIRRLRRHYNARVHILLTGRDLGPPDQSLNFVFSYNDHTEKITVLSAARLLFTLDEQPASLDLIRARMHKMLLRTLAFQYYEQERSSNPSDLTYSPLMSLEDVDLLGVKNIPKPKEPTI